MRAPLLPIMTIFEVRTLLPSQAKVEEGSEG